LGNKDNIAEEDNSPQNTGDLHKSDKRPDDYNIENKYSRKINAYQSNNSQVDTNNANKQQIDNDKYKNYTDRPNNLQNPNQTNDIQNNNYQNQNNVNQLVYKYIMYFRIILITMEEILYDHRILQ